MRKGRSKSWKRCKRRKMQRDWMGRAIRGEGGMNLFLFFG